MKLYQRPNTLQCLCPGCRDTAAPYDIYCWRCREEMDAANDLARQQAQEAPSIHRSVRLVMAASLLVLIGMFVYDAVTR